MIKKQKKYVRIIEVQIYKLHALSGERKGQYAMDLGRKLGFRLIIYPLDEQGHKYNETDIIKLYNSTKIVLIWEVSNHYE